MRIAHLSRLAAVCLLLGACAAADQKIKLPKNDASTSNGILVEDVTFVGQVGVGIALPVDQCEESDEQGAVSCAPAGPSSAPVTLSPNRTQPMGSLLKPLVDFNSKAARPDHDHGV